MYDFQSLNKLLVQFGQDFWFKVCYINDRDELCQKKRKTGIDYLVKSLLMITASHLVCQPIYLAPSVHKDNTLGNGQGLIKITKCIQLPFLPLDIDMKLLDPLQGKLITFYQNPHRFVHELPCDLQGLRWHSGRENTNLNFGWQQLKNIIDLGGGKTKGVD